LEEYLTRIKTKSPSIIIWAFLPLLFLVVSACESQQEILKKEANAFCEIHNPENWKEFAKTGSPAELEKELNKRIDKAIKTKALKDVIAELNQVEFMRELYPTAQKKISNLIGENWDCPFYQEFYSVRFERHPAPPSAIYISNDTIVVGIDANGNYTVNSMELMDNKPETLKDAIKTVAATSPPKVVVKTEENTPKESLDSALHVLYEMGVKKSTIITP
jgi:hypothetical protein